MMPMHEASKAATRRFVDAVWNGGQYDIGLDHLVPDFVNHTPFGDETREQYLDRIKAFRGGFPDLHLTVGDMLADGDRVITRFTLRGTHAGRFRGMPLTGRNLTVMGIAIDRVVQGRRVEGWALLDLFGLMQQIGASR